MSAASTSRQAVSDEIVDICDEPVAKKAKVGRLLLFLSDEAHFDLSNPAWQPGLVPAVQAVRRVGNLGSAPRGTGFSSADLVNRMMQ